MNITNLVNIIIIIYYYVAQLHQFELEHRSHYFTVIARKNTPRKKLRRESHNRIVVCKRASKAEQCVCHRWRACVAGTALSCAQPPMIAHVLNPVLPTVGPGDLAWMPRSTSRCPESHAAPTAADRLAHTWLQSCLVPSVAFLVNVLACASQH